MNPLVHSDSRRELIDYTFDFSVKSLKVIKCFTSQDLGNHYHVKKTELFFLLQGRIKTMITNDQVLESLDAPFAWRVEPNEFHSILPEEGAVIICLSDHSYDPLDEVINE